MIWVHLKFHPEVKFSILTQVEKTVVTREFQPGAKRMFFYFISSRSETTFAKICDIFYKNVLRKKPVSHAVTGLYKNYDIRFHQQQKMFNFKMSKIILLATINSIIVTASFLLNFV